MYAKINADIDYPERSSPKRQQNVTKTLNDSPLRIYENRFQQLANNELDLAFAKQLYLPKDTLLTLLKSADLKPSAQRLITDQSGEHLLYSSMNYGAGRISYLNFPSTWIWQMREHNGKNLFAKFWGTTISLMAVANRPRIELLPSSNQVISRENEIMKVKLLNADYQYQAAQSISIWLKDEIKKETIKLEALPSQTIGFYDIPIDNIPAGRYAIHIDAQMANHDKLRLKRYIDFTNENSEPIDTPANFGLMKLLSEQTGGQMFIESEIPKILEINWPKAYKQETKKFAFRESKVYYILLFMLLFLDWLIRRKTEW